MKILFENWRKFLKENEEAGEGAFPYQIYCDMDGVLVDFVGGAIEQINIDIKNKNITDKKMNKLRHALSQLDRDSITSEDLDKMDKENRLQAARNYMYKRFEDNEDFWASLPWAEGGKELWSYISKYDPYILTAPMSGEGSKRGKRMWIKNNLQPAPKKIFMSHEKYKWAGPTNILIDDFKINTIPWHDNKGIAILHTSTKETKKELKALTSTKQTPEEELEEAGMLSIPAAGTTSLNMNTQENENLKDEPLT